MGVSIQTSQAWLARSGSAVVLSLQALKEQVQARWDSIRIPTGASLERLFRAKLGPSDRFVQIDEVSWLVVMPDTDLDNALACCLRIAYQLHTSVAGRCDIGQLKIASAAMTAADALELTPLTDEQLRAAAHRAGLDELLAARTPIEEAPEWCSFEPVWDAHSQAISGYRCLPGDNAGENASVSQQLKETQAMLAGTARLLGRLIVEGQRCIMFVPIPYDVLSAPPARMELLSTCRQLKCELRPLLVFEIATLGAGIPKQRLAEMVSAIQPFARAVIARATLRNRSLMDYGGAGLKALGFELTTSQSDESEVERLYKTGRRLGLASYLCNATFGRTVEQATALGMQWISGPAIGEVVDEPAPPGRLTLESILQSLEPPAVVGATA